MESEFCKEYISLFHRWKSRLHSEHLDAEQHHTAVKKLFLRLVNLQFCIENKWASFEVSDSESSMFETSLLPLFASPRLVQSRLFNMQNPEIENVPNALLFDLFGSDGLFQKTSFCGDEYGSNKACITPAIMATLFEELAQDRHYQGTYYTSSDVVGFMVQKSLEKRFGTTPNEQQLLNMTLIDPACGSGALLIGAAEETFRLFKPIQTTSSNLEFKFHLASKCLYGIDLEQMALDVTQTRLWYWVNCGLSEPRRLDNSNLVKGNSVTGSNPQEDGLVIGFEFRQQFLEIFCNDSPGFDIIIANPPYVRQESIDKTVKEHVLSHNLFQGVISGMSDLYAYFYARATQLLKTGGVSSFICSNTWMDVQYGRLLQKEFLSNFSDIEIIGCKLLRQFSTAEINTVMTFMTKKTNQKSIVEFTMLNADFQSSINSKVNQTKQCITQLELLHLGMSESKYVGSKWSLFLHAPPLYHELMDEMKDRFISIGELCQRTLRNNLRVLPKGYSVGLNLSKKAPSMAYVKSFKDVESVRVSTESQHSVAHPDLFSSLSSPNYCRPDLVANRFYNSRIFFIEGGDYFVSDSFFLGKLKDEYRSQEVILSLNSTISLFFVELCGRKGLGGGLLSFYGPEFNAHQTLHPSVFSKVSDKIYQQFVERQIFDVFEECGFDKQRAFLPSHHDDYLSLRAQQPNPLPDRKAIDNAAFDALNLSLEQRNEVYWSLCESVQSRLQKATSV
ncbi:MAG: N-6 DNA methylase [Euryarchaeota archaeon]|nr:N-6 DNA methylase [Euryarchaeota archaeon]